MVRCAQCREENAAGADACAGCGRPPGPLSALLGEVCTTCDGWSPPGSATCALCGETLAAMPPVVATGGEEPGSDDEAISPRELTPAAEIIDADEEDNAPFLADHDVLLDPTEEPTEPPPGPPAPGPPAPGLRASVLVIDPAGSVRRAVELEAESTSVGRGGTPLSFPDDTFLAPVHATFLLRGETLALRDQGAANGVYLRLRGPHPLRPGDLFVVGERVLRYGGASTLVAPAELRHGSPRPGDRLHSVEEVLEGGGVGRVCRRAGPALSIGRVGCDLTFFADAVLAPRHAELTLSTDGAMLRDLSGTSGTYVRIAPWSEQPLAHGDQLRLGRETLRVELAPV